MLNKKHLNLRGMASEDFLQNPSPMALQSLATRLGEHHADKAATLSYAVNMLDDHSLSKPAFRTS